MRLDGIHMKSKDNVNCKEDEDSFLIKKIKPLVLVQIIDKFQVKYLNILHTPSKNKFCL
jgi:hypothetical protein